MLAKAGFKYVVTPVLDSTFFVFLITIYKQHHRQQQQQQWNNQKQQQQYYLQEQDNAKLQVTVIWGKCMTFLLKHIFSTENVSFMNSLKSLEMNAVWIDIRSWKVILHVAIAVFGGWYATIRLISSYKMYI